MIAFRLHRFIALSCCLWLYSLPSLQAESHGGIEIGAKGIRAIVVDVAEKESDSKVLMLENKNTTLVADLGANKVFSAKALEDTVELIGQFTTKMRDEFKVPNGRIYIVGSSGIFAPLEGDKANMEKSKDLLVKAIHKKTDITMDFVSITREAELTIISVIPSTFRDDAVLLDIGSGNTKGGAEKKGAGLITFGIPYGTVSFSDHVKKAAAAADEPFPRTADKLREKTLLPKFQEALTGKAELADRKRIYLAGGTVWALTTFMKPADRSNYVKLSTRDIESFHKFLLDHEPHVPNVEVKGASAETTAAALKDMEQVRQTFSREQLIGGVEILKALSTSFRLNGEGRQVYFARNAYIGWILGYTLEKGRHVK